MLYELIPSAIKVMNESGPPTLAPNVCFKVQYRKKGRFISYISVVVNSLKMLKEN